MLITGLRNGKPHQIEVTVDPANVARADARRGQHAKSDHATSAKAALSATDWWVTRQSEGRKAMTDAQKAYRAALVEVANNPDPSVPFPVKPV